MHFTARGAGDGDPSTLSVCVCVCGVCAHVCNVVLNLIASREARYILQPGGYTREHHDHVVKEKWS